MRVAFFVPDIGIGEVLRADAEVDAAVARVDGHPQGVDAVKRFLPSFGDRDFLVRDVVGIRVDDEQTLHLGGDEHAGAMLVAGRREVHADRRANLALVLPEQRRLVFEPVAVAIREKINIAVVCQCNELAVARGTARC